MIAQCDACKVWVTMGGKEAGISAEEWEKRIFFCRDCKIEKAEERVGMLVGVVEKQHMVNRALKDHLARHEEKSKGETRA